MLGVFAFLSMVLIVGPFVARALGLCPAQACMPRPRSAAGGLAADRSTWSPGALAIGHQTASVAAPPAVGGGRAPETPFSRDGIDVFRIEGRVEASALNRMRKLVESDPERGLAVIRSWLHESEQADRRRKQLKMS